MLTALHDQTAKNSAFGTKVLQVQMMSLALSGSRTMSAPAKLPEPARLPILHQGL
jgi:hypothetical protein